MSTLSSTTLVKNQRSAGASGVAYSLDGSLNHQQDFSALASAPTGVWILASILGGVATRDSDNGPVAPETIFVGSPSLQGRWNGSKPGTKNVDPGLTSSFNAPFVASAELCQLAAPIAPGDTIQADFNHSDGVHSGTTASWGPYLLFVNAATFSPDLEVVDLGAGLTGRANNWDDDATTGNDASPLFMMDKLIFTGGPLSFWTSYIVAWDDPAATFTPTDGSILIDEGTHTGLGQRAQLRAFWLLPDPIADVPAGGTLSGSAHWSIAIQVNAALAAAVVPPPSTSPFTHVAIVETRTQ